MRCRAAYTTPFPCDDRTGFLWKWTGGFAVCWFMMVRLHAHRGGLVPFLQTSSAYRNRTKESVGTSHSSPSFTESRLVLNRSLTLLDIFFFLRHRASPADSRGARRLRPLLLGDAALPHGCPDWQTTLKNFVRRREPRSKASRSSERRGRAVRIGGRGVYAGSTVASACCGIADGRTGCLF